MPNNNAEISIDPARRREKEMGYDWTMEITWNRFQTTSIHLTDAQLLELTSKAVARVPDVMETLKGEEA